MKEVLKYSVWSGLFAVLIVPFLVFNSMVFPTITAKVFVFRILVEILLGLWFILIIKDREYRPKFSWILGCAGIFTLILLVTDILAVSPLKAFWSDFERMEGWITIGHLFAYLIVLGSMFKTERMWLYFLRAFVSFSFIMSLIGLSETSGGSVRVSGLFGNPIYLGVYFLFTVFFTLILIYKDVITNFSSNSLNSFKNISKNWLFYFYSIVIFVSLYLIYLSSRGAFLGLLGGLLFVMVLLALFEKKHLIVRRASIAGIFLIIILVGGFISIRQTNFVKNNPTLSRLAEISWNSTDQSGQSRQLIWAVAFEGFKEKPISGWGQEGFSYVFEKYYNSKIYNLDPSWFDRVHNTPLDFLIAGGILGLLSYLSLFIAALYLLWCKITSIDTLEKSLIIGLLAGYFFQSLFIFDNITSYILSFTVLAYVHFRFTESLPLRETPIFKIDKKNIRNGNENEDYQNYIFIPSVIILTLGIIWWVNIPAISACVDLKTALQMEKDGNISASLDMYKKALAYESFGDEEIREQLLITLSGDIVSSALDQKTKTEYLQFIFDEGKKQISLSPQDAKYYFFTGSFLNTTGNSSLALDYLNKAKDLMPNYQPIRFEIIKALLALNRRAEAMAEARFTYELDPSYVDAKFLYASTAVYNHQNNAADSLLAGLKTPFDKIKEVYYIEVSEAYKAGDKAKAVADIEKLIEINPVFKTEGGQVIAGIRAGMIDVANQKQANFILHENN